MESVYSSETRLNPPQIKKLHQPDIEDHLSKTISRMYRCQRENCVTTIFGRGQSAVLTHLVTITLKSTLQTSIDDVNKNVSAKFLKEG